MKTSPLSEPGYSQSQSRLTRLAIMPLGDIHNTYEKDIVGWLEVGVSMSLLERNLVFLSLRGTGTRTELTGVWHRAEIRPGRLQYIDNRMLEYAREFLARVNTMWTTPPYNNPSLIIYSADALRYVDDALVIEVQYREALPS